MKMTFADRFFHAISTVFSPLLVPTYGLVLAMSLTVLSFLPPATRWSTIAVLCSVTALVPAGSILVMRRLGLVSDVSLSSREERTAPLMVACVCYLASTFYLVRVHAPSWLWLYFCGGFVAVLIVSVVSRRWKISAHMTAMGGLVALLCRLQSSGLAIHDMTWWIAGAVVVTGLVGTARIYRERHDLWQVLAGTACGFVCVYFITMIPVG